MLTDATRLSPFPLLKRRLLSPRASLLMTVQRTNWSELSMTGRPRCLLLIYRPRLAVTSSGLTGMERRRTRRDALHRKRLWHLFAALWALTGTEVRAWSCFRT